MTMKLRSGSSFIYYHQSTHFMLTIAGVAGEFVLVIRAKLISQGQVHLSANLKIAICDGVGKTVGLVTDLAALQIHSVVNY